MHLPTEDVNLKIVEVLTDDYKFEQRTILYREIITRAEIEAIVRQRHTIMTRGASTKDRNVGQALIANKPGRRIPRNVPFAIANRLSTYYSWATVNPVMPRVPHYIG